jgi:hypothetical protein
MEDPIDPVDAQVRSLRQSSLNGLDESVLGLFFCALGAIYLPEHALQRATFFGQRYAMIAPYLQMVCCVGMVVTLKRLRAKLIFPRTGYVVFRPGKSRTWMMVTGLGAVIAIAVAALFWRSAFANIERVAGPAFAITLAACFVPGGIVYRLPHLTWLGGWALILGAATYFIGAEIEGALWVMVGVGAAMALSGALRLRKFLQTHPIVEDHHA